VKKRRNWLDWVSIAQFVQFNRFEAENVWGRRIDNQNEMLSFGKAIMKYGKTEAVIVTLGKDGSIITYKSKRGVECEYIEATQVGNPIDATGCGDVYASAFAFYYVRFGNIIEACAFASKMAARKCVVSGIANMDKVFNDYHHSRRELSATANN
jgi:sugar/nucleoside kinase (ribokinase family)